MSTFNFGDVNTTSAVNNSSNLKPWGIYDVEFDGLELNDIQGKKDPDKTYHTIKMSFHGEEGSFSTNLFIPSSEDDTKRIENKSKDGHVYYSPSKFEIFKWTLLQLVQVVNPEGYEKLKAASNKITSMDSFIKVIFKFANEKKGAKTKLKLTGRNNDGKIYPQIPRICGINKNGECFVSNNFVGNKLEFTAWEASQVMSYKNTKPTEMPDIASQVEGVDESSDIDFDSLL